MMRSTVPLDSAVPPANQTSGRAHRVMARGKTRL